MSYGEHWASLDGVELWNSARTTAYLANGLAMPGLDSGKCLSCEGIGQAVEDPGFEGYTVPEDDNAPWYDPARPESANFAGLLVTEITGLMDSPFTRAVTSTINGGGAFGRMTVNPRQVTVRGMLFGRTCCSIAYGQRWLTSALVANVGPCDCRAGTFCFLTCCPNLPDESSDCGPNAEREPIPDETSYYDEFFRSTCNAGLVSGPRVISRVGEGCGCGGCVALEVEFTLAMGPYLFGQPVPCLEAALLSSGETMCNIEPDNCELVEVQAECTDCDTEIIWVAGGGGSCCDDVDCDGALCHDNCDAPCFDDPLCPIPAPPPQPPVPLDRCFANCNPAMIKRLCCQIDGIDVQEWSDAVVNIEIYSGSQSLRNVKILAYPNPVGRDPDEFTDCDACAGFVVNYIPCDATMKINGTCRTATIECDSDMERDAVRNLSDINGRPFDHPVLSCTNWLICIDADATEMADDATISITLVPREA